MLNLIKSDLYKALHMKSFYVCGIFCVLCAIINTIGMYAFRNCSNLKEVIIPDSITSINTTS